MLKQIKQRDKSSVFFFPCKLFCIYFYFCPQINKSYVPKPDVAERSRSIKEPIKTHSYEKTFPIINVFPSSLHHDGPSGIHL